MTTSRTGLTRLALTLCLVPASPLLAQSSGGTVIPQVLVLGTYHLEGSGRNVSQYEVADVLSPEEQTEIRQIVEALAGFRPTKIAIAATPRFDRLYTAYRSGRHELNRDEWEQLGFRIGSILGHETLYSIDHRNDFPYPAMMEYAQVHDPDFVTFVEQEIARIEAEATRLQPEYTVGQILRWRNSPENLSEDHAIYGRFAGVGAGDTYVGADLVTKWYGRNLRIFANLQGMIEPGDRVLVIFGSGHAPILRQLVADHPEMILVDALEYLPHDGD